MALRAGYKGVKKSVLDSLLSLVGAVIIEEIGDGLTLTDENELEADVKSIGNGLTLSEAGELAADIDPDTMEFTEAGKLACKATGGVSYSSEWQDTGLTWVNGEHIMQKTYHQHYNSPTNFSQGGDISFDNTLLPTTHQLIDCEYSIVSVSSNYADNSCHRAASVYITSYDSRGLDLSFDMQANGITDVYLTARVIELGE